MSQSEESKVVRLENWFVNGKGLMQGNVYGHPTKLNGQSIEFGIKLRDPNWRWVQSKHRTYLLGRPRKFE